MGKGIAVTANSLFSFHTHTQTLSSFNHSTTRLFTPTPTSFPAKFRLRLQASSSTAFIDANLTGSIVVEKEVIQSSNLLACPICYDSLTWIGDPGFFVDAIPGSSLQCSTCQKTYVGNQTHLDLIATSGAKTYGEPIPVSTELFRLPLISFLYERGWRQSFSVWGGFPGPEKELGKEGNPKRLICSSVSTIMLLMMQADFKFDISRVLRPGGVFVATTFILDGPFTVVPFLSRLRQNIRQVSGSYIFLSEHELEALCRACGLVGFKCIKMGLL